MTLIILMKNENLRNFRDSKWPNEENSIHKKNIRRKGM